jgi:hypothetical protein
VVQTISSQLRSGSSDIRDGSESHAVVPIFTSESRHRRIFTRVRTRCVRLDRLSGMNGGPGTPAKGLFAVLAVAAMVYAAPCDVMASTGAPPISLTASYSSADGHDAAIPQLGGLRPYAYPLRQPGSPFPERRRRHHFWDNVTHFGTSGGAFSWLLLAPIFILVLVAAVAFTLRRRFKRRRRRGEFSGMPPFDPTPQRFDSQPLAQHPAAAAPPSTGERGDRLTRLEKLHQSGAISDEEFLIQRQRIIDGP